MIYSVSTAYCVWPIGLVWSVWGDWQILSKWHTCLLPTAQYTVHTGYYMFSKAVYTDGVGFLFHQFRHGIWPKSTMQKLCKKCLRSSVTQYCYMTCLHWMLMQYSCSNCYLTNTRFNHKIITIIMNHYNCMTCIICTLMRYNCV